MSASASTSAAATAATGTSKDVFDDEILEGGEDENEQDPGLEIDEDEEEEGEDQSRAADMHQGEEEVAHFEEEIYESESASDTGTDSLTWISWFCSLPGHEYFAEVSEDFIEDDFNLTGLNALVPFYKEALEMILDVEPQEDTLKIPDVSIVESSAELLYGLIHQRYILTRQGLQQMVEKYERGHFGFCPRVFCHSHPVLPCGRSDLPGLDTVKLFCANCIDNYSPPSSRFHGVDGAFFGTTFPHLLFQTYRELAPSPIAPPGTNFSSLNTQSGLQRTSNGTIRETSVEPVADAQSSASSAGGAAAAAAASKGASVERRNTSATSGPSLPLTASTLQQSLLGQRVPQARLYTPRIYGFRVSEHAKSGPRMRWMRMRPESFEELDTGIVESISKTASMSTRMAGTTIASGTECQDTTMAIHPTHHNVTADGRSTVTGRPITGRSPSSAAATAAQQN